MLNVLWVGLATLLALFNEPSVAKNISTEPSVRVQQNMHTARIEQVRADAGFERLFSISADKTLRIWRLRDLTLLRQVNLPSAPGIEGTPSGLTITADGSHAYVGGATGWAWHGASHVYEVDADSGRITRSLGQFAGDVVVSLDLSPDGMRLAVGLAKGGLRVISTEGGQTLQQDTAYAGPVTFVHHAADGRLATTSTDGCLRLYRADFSLQLRYQYPKKPTEPQCTGAELGGVRYSPDGKWLAFGSRVPTGTVGQAPKVVVLDVSKSEAVLGRVIEATDPLQASLCCIAWAPDSQTLYVNGQADDRRPIPLYRISPVITGRVERWDVGRQQITNMLPLPDGDVVFSTAVPSLVRVSSTGRIRSGSDGLPMVVAPSNLDFFSTRHNAAALRASADGRTVAVQTTEGSTLRLRLDAEQLSEALSSMPTATADAERLSSAERAGALKVKTDLGFFGYRSPTTVNGVPVPLQREESVWSWAGHASLPLAALGTQWRVLLVGPDGKPAPGWDDPPVLPAPAYHTVISADGRWVIVALGDGTLRWFAVNTGREVLGVFIHSDGREWAAWRQDGYYMSSTHGDNFIAWVKSRGEGREAELIRAVQLERTLFRPDLVQAALAPPAPSSRSRAIGADQPTGLAGLAVPQVHIDALSEATREVTFSVEPAGQPVSAVGVYVDGIPLLPPAEQRVSQGSQRFQRTVKIPPGFPVDVVRVEAEASGVIGLDVAGAVRRIEATPHRGKLWVLAIGVEQFDDFSACGKTRRCRVNPQPLPNAPSDARALADLLGKAGDGAFSSVSLEVLTERDRRKPTKAAILQALQRMEQARADDTVLVFLASHGLVGGPGGAEYYFLPADGQVADVERLVIDGYAGRADSLLSGSELSAALRRVAGRRLLIIDSCHSGAADGRSDPYSMAKRSASAQVAVMSAAEGNELSLEHIDPSVPHGIFTFALLQGLQGAADADGDGRISVEELLQFASPIVSRNAEQVNAQERVRNPRYRDISQTPVLTALPALRRSVLRVSR